ncbi:hypothetical protein L211DRAFT_843918 [Terfezia boudieri ATCC MYA-4762]|uniref:Uncharacterized protein n=1 Tax=Terfezia boudieri ATCC MYA-4762 TaxID=1051890 RepID=A0A3N4L6K9_9PEZI|nr:hypothetical protein L211DRAFT_843918 [Terfezia boudieri ATCC MYA-4762]
MSRNISKQNTVFTGVAMLLYYSLPRFKAFNSPRQVLRYALRKYQSIEFSNIELERYHTALDRTFYHTQPTPRGTCISDFYPSPIVHPPA